MGGHSTISDPHSSTRILIVDDEPYVCRVLSRWLSSEGYDCTTADSADEAWECLQSEDFSLVVSDIVMPGRSGIELLRMTRERLGDEVAFVMVTALDDRETAVRALQLGACGYTLKPFNKNEVILNIFNALERRRLTLESRAYELRLEEKVREQIEEIHTSREDIALRLIAAQEYRHDETGAHIRRISLYAEVLAERMRYPAEQVEMLRLAAPMHDVGKIGVKDSILLKPGKLTEDEFEAMKAHTIIGARILEGSTVPLVNIARDIALSHHEKWDGNGYTEGISGENIPEPARIVALIDVYDALVHDRVYRPAVPEKDAIALMTEGQGKHFDPKIFETFLESLPELRRIRHEIKEKGR